MSDTDFDKRVRERAYHLWEQAGCPDDRGEDFWHEALHAVASENRAALDHASQDKTTDLVGEDTFPASDPPSHGGSTGPND